MLPVIGFRCPVIFVGAGIGLLKQLEETGRLENDPPEWAKLWTIG
jgi:hypothetical protein